MKLLLGAALVLGAIVAALFHAAVGLARDGARLLEHKPMRQGPWSELSPPEREAINFHEGHIGFPDRDEWRRR